MDPAAPHHESQRGLLPSGSGQDRVLRERLLARRRPPHGLPHGTPLVCKFNDTSVWPSSDPYSALTSQGTQRWLNPTITNKSDLTVTCYNLTG